MASFLGSPRNKVFIVGLMASLLLAVFLFIKPNNSSVETVQAENTTFSSEVLHFDDILIQLLNSSHNETEHTFHFSIENINHKEISISNTSFSIRNNGNTYSSERVQLTDHKLNPGMSTSVIVTFKMNENDLMEGNPVMAVKRGFLFNTTIQEFKLDDGR
ncbi:hypothetical protein [Sporosarcina highlanderae]|uniref:DUF4352 domain-containing protein n=1 Tax=Sporosarcina highlanderae TaxID=3035916 RepID=A0ABT8JUN0_9BACL|nr:hypothetical protein [Sporosarcina highlanderae]MDN4608087.1 hypothetical protein [Sporosarcina highlanderae]